MPKKASLHNPTLKIQKKRTAIGPTLIRDANTRPASLLDKWENRISVALFVQ